MKYGKLILSFIFRGSFWNEVRYTWEKTREAL